MSQIDPGYPLLIMTRTIVIIIVMIVMMIVNSECDFIFMNRKIKSNPIHFSHTYLHSYLCYVNRMKGDYIGRTLVFMSCWFSFLLQMSTD
jgi:hypothetical protein